MPPEEITDEGNDHEQSLGGSSEGQPGEALYKGCYQVRRQVAVGRETEETSMDKSQQASQQTHQPKLYVKLRIGGILQLFGLWSEAKQEYRVSSAVWNKPEGISIQCMSNL